jgi:effector-binding domain-containing protein
MVFRLLSMCIVLTLTSCGNDTVKNEPPPVIIYKKDKDSINNPRTGERAPIINITDTAAPKLMVLCVKDSAASSQRIGVKLAYIYNNVLSDVIRQNKLTRTGARMAWYKSSSAPFFFEAGIPVNKKPAKLPKKVYVKHVGGDSAVIAHFYGPYELSYYAYEALRDWLKSNKKKTASPPYEMYIGEAVDEKGNPVDPYKIRTDIVFPH